MITRNELYRDYCNKKKEYLDDRIIIQAFKSLNDEELAETFNLKVLRKGYFVNK